MSSGLAVLSSASVYPHCVSGKARYSSEKVGKTDRSITIARMRSPVSVSVNAIVSPTAIFRRFSSYSRSSIVFCPLLIIRNGSGFSRISCSIDLCRLLTPDRALRECPFCGSRQSTAPRSRAPSW